MGLDFGQGLEFDGRFLLLRLVGGGGAGLLFPVVDGLRVGADLDVLV
jgi:hypothetical protein